MTNYNRRNIENMLFLDIETVREYKTFNEFIEKHKLDNWKKVGAKYYGDLLASEVPNDEDIYVKKASLHPEYSKIVCISFGFLVNVDGVYQKKLYSIAHVDEKLLLTKFADQITKAYEKNLNTLLCGHNVLEFDIPFIIKRMIKHGIKIPIILQNVIVCKPWESKVVDTMKDWKMNTTKIVSMDVIAEFLAIPSSKIGVVNGSNMSQYYWDLQEASLPEISEYCKADVSVTMEIVEKLAQV